MAREDEGNYGGKHSDEIEINPEIAERIWKYGNEKSIDCIIAHKIAQELDLQPEEIGETLDLMEFKITKCQIGLFGYGAEGKKIKILDDVPEDLEKSLKKRAPDGSLSCLDIWKAAAESNVSRLSAACGAETPGFKIKECQLGAF